MRRPILLDTPPRPLPSDRYAAFLTSTLSAKALGALGVAAVIGASVGLAVLMPYAVPETTAQQAAPQVQAAAVTAAPSAKPAAKPVAASNVQYVGDVRQPDRPCAEQTWPYISKECLKPAADQKAAPATPRVAVDRADIKASRAGMPAPAQPAAAAQPEPTVAAVPPAAVQPAPQPVAEAAPAPIPAARPSSKQARYQAAREAYASVPETRDKAKRSRASSREARDIRPDAYRSDAQRSAAADRNPSPVVRRWTESEYDVPGPFGSTRRVMVIRQQSVHQAAAFDDER